MSIALLHDLRIAVGLAFWPTLCHVCASPAILLHPARLSRLVFHHVWSAFAPGADAHSADTKAALITPNASGVVLDIGAGYGHAARYLDTSRVTKYVALEPNPLMHPEIRRIARDVGFTEEAGTLLILACGAEDTTTILTSLGAYQPADTIVSVLSLCSVPDPCDTIASLVKDVLKPGGHFLFFEHVRNPLPHVAWWQTFWSPLWGLAFDGCNLDRPTHLWVQKAGGWATEELNQPDEPDGHLFTHRIGKFVKASVA